MKAVQLLVNSILPEDLRDYSRTYDSKGISKLMAQVAELHPEQYDKIATGMVNIGRKASWNQGETLRLNDLRPTFDRAPVFAAMDAEVKKARRASKTDAEFERARNDIWQRYSDQIEKSTSGSALSSGNNLAFAVSSGARGKAPQLKAMLSTPGTYTDYAGTTLPLFVRNSFSEGLRPMEYLAGTFGARSAVLCLARGTLVRMADGTTREIQDVTVGDMVIGAVRKGGFKSVKVVSVFQQGLQPVKRWYFNSDNGTGQVVVECTSGHKVLNVVSDIVPISDVSGIKLQMGRAWWTRKADEVGQVECFDLEVDHPDHLFVLANGMIVSNSTKRATAKGGYLSKMLANVAAEQVVTTKDCGTTNGIDLDPDDPSLRGRVLATAIDGIPAGTPIEKSVLSRLQKHKGKILVRSALTCTAEHGVCSQCFGKRMDNKFPHIGDHVGDMASNAVGEPITQQGLNAKHTAGMGSGKKVYSGFDTINSLVQSPEIFPDRAEVSQVDGRVERVEPAPQGGFNITVAGQVHYAPHGYDVLVKPGQEVEAGDQLSDGVVDVRDVIQHKGLGEGRRYYAERLKQALDDSGMAANQRNTEVIARAAVNHVVIDDPEGDGEFMTDDVAPYDKMAARYVPAESTKAAAPDSSVKGHFLQAPVLHYSIGTRLTPSKIKRISDAGIKQIHTAETGPTWQPQMTRLATASHNSPDWIARMGASHIGTNLEDSAARGLDSDVNDNFNFIPRLAYGENFGKNVRETGKF